MIIKTFGADQPVENPFREQLTKEQASVLAYKELLNKQAQEKVTQAGIWALKQVGLSNATALAVIPIIGWAVTAYAVLQFLGGEEYFADIEQWFNEVMGWRKRRLFSDEELNNFIVRRYSEELHRPPDEAGYKHWFENIMYGRLLPGDLDSALANSDERKNILSAEKSAKEKFDWEFAMALEIKKAYNDILGRDPMPLPGQADIWYGYVVDGKMTIAEVRQAFYNSEEYRAKHPVSERERLPDTYKVAKTDPLPYIVSTAVAGALLLFS